MKYPRKKIRPTKYPQKEILDPRKNLLDPRNTNEKTFWTHEIPTRKNVRSTRKKFPIHEISTRKKSGPTMARWYDGTRPTEFRRLNLIDLKTFDLLLPSENILPS